MYFFKLFKRFYLFLDRGEGVRKRGRETSMCGCTRAPPTGDLAYNPVKACALTGNWTGDSLVHRPALNPLSHTSQDLPPFYLFFSGVFSCYFIWGMFLNPTSILAASLCLYTVHIRDRKGALAGVAQWIECWPENQRVTGSIPSQGTCLGCGPGPQWGLHERQPHINVSLPLFLPPFPSKKK